MQVGVDAGEMLQGLRVLPIPFPLTHGHVRLAALGARHALLHWPGTVERWLLILHKGGIAMRMHSDQPCNPVSDGHRCPLTLWLKGRHARLQM